jgi:hypothetical protein
MPNIKAIRINPAGQVVALDNPAKVSKNFDQVLWIAIGGGGPWTVTFDKAATTIPGDQTNYPIASGSPFAPNGTALNPFNVGAGASGGVSGPVTGLVGRTYRYNVRNAAGVVTHDPDVDIES